MAILFSKQKRILSKKKTQLGTPSFSTLWLAYDYPVATLTYPPNLEQILFDERSTFRGKHANRADAEPLLLDAVRRSPRVSKLS